MTSRNMNQIIQHVRRTMLREQAAMTDRQLLDSFVQQADDAAFAALVHRLGPMVWGVCRRLLHRHHDAEDAFQATFLVLVRKAATIRDREKLANWLYGVAQQTAIRASKDATRHATRERQVNDIPEPVGKEPDPSRNDLSPLLDQELSRLPAKYRETLICCDLMGQTRREAAQRLGCPEGTVAGRLARARELLARRLARHGLVVSGGVLAVALSPDAASASVPPFVLSTTIQAAKLLLSGEVTGGVISLRIAGLTEGVLKAMWLSKIPIQTMALLLVAVFGTGLVLSSTGEPTPQKKQPDPAAQARPDTAGGAVAASDIVGALQTNEALFDEKFSDQEVTVTGQAGGIRRLGDRYVLSLGGGALPISVQFSLDDRKMLAALGHGQKVTVRGVIQVNNIDPFSDKREIYILKAKVVKDGDK